MFNHSSILVLFALLFGLCVGSFLNVVIHRLPYMLKLTAEALPEGERYDLCWPASHCPQCKSQLYWRDNVPLFSWLLLRGKCRSCQGEISWQYPLVELLAGFMTCVIVILYPPSGSMIAMLILSWLLLTLAVIDLQTFYLPDVLTQPLLWGGLLGSMLGYTPADLHSSLIGACAGYLSFWGLNLLARWFMKKEGMGGGDLKLFAGLGAWFGWQALSELALIAAVSAIVFTLTADSKKNVANGTNKMIPFGPYLAIAGCFFIIFIGWQ